MQTTKKNKEQRRQNELINLYKKQSLSSFIINNKEHKKEGVNIQTNAPIISLFDVVKSLSITGSLILFQLFLYFITIKRNL